MIAIKKYIEDSPVITTSMIEFSETNEDEYISLFNKYKINNVIDENTSFYNNKWLVTKACVDKQEVSFIFNEILFKKMTKNKKLDLKYKDFILAVKSFFLYQLNSYTTSTLNQFIRALKNLMSQTEYTNKSLPEHLNYKSSLIDSIPAILEFFMYYEDLSFNDNLLDELGTMYLENLETRRKTGDGKRVLPTFNTMFKFNDIMNEFIRTSKGKIRELYFPLILWWKITTILPLRNMEFTIIPKECLIQIDGIWHIRVFRSKIKGGCTQVYTHDFYSTYESSSHPITDEIKGLIIEYTKLVSKYDTMKNFFADDVGDIINRDFLLSARSYFLFNKNKSKYLNSKRILDFFSPIVLNCLLKRFLFEIVYGQYGIDIVPKERDNTSFTDAIFSNCINNINLMDTRHFAIMNMVYMGYEPNTIQRIVGHKKISTSYGYYSHAEIFTNCYTISIAKEIAFAKNSEFKNEILDMDFDNLFGNESEGNIRYNMVKSKKIDNEIKLKMLDDGYCSYNRDDFIPCKLLRGNHKRCKFFAPYSNKIQLINEELEKISEEISSEIKTLQYLATNYKNIKNFLNLYNVSINKIHSKVLIKAELISDYMITGVSNID